MQKITFFMWNPPPKRGKWSSGRSPHTKSDQGVLDLLNRSQLSSAEAGRSCQRRRCMNGRGISALSSRGSPPQRYLFSRRLSFLCPRRAVVSDLFVILSSHFFFLSVMDGATEAAPMD